MFAIMYATPNIFGCGRTTLQSFRNFNLMGRHERCVSMPTRNRPEIVNLEFILFRKLSDSSDGALFPPIYEYLSLILPNYDPPRSSSTFYLNLYSPL